MIKCRGVPFRDEDDAYDYFRQREIDEKAARERLMQPCHSCEMKYAGAVCPACKTERPAYTALKAMTARLPLTECSYYHGQPCNCGGRGVCLPAA